MQYDMIYHEHLYYYSLLSAMKHFENYEMMIFDIKPIPIHAGSMRLCMQKGGKYSKSVSPSVKELEARNVSWVLIVTKPLVIFLNLVESQRYELIKLLNRLKKKTKILLVTELLVGQIQ